MRLRYLPSPIPQADRSLERIPHVRRRWPGARCQATQPGGAILNNVVTSAILDAPRPLIRRRVEYSSWDDPVISSGDFLASDSCQGLASDYAVALCGRSASWLGSAPKRSHARASIRLPLAEPRSTGPSEPGWTPQPRDNPPVGSEPVRGRASVGSHRPTSASRRLPPLACEYVGSFRTPDAALYADRSRCAFG
jgi:hypothetical protein